MYPCVYALGMTLFDVMLVVVGGAVVARLLWRVVFGPDGDYVAIGYKGLW